jgi:hypothetical protein
MSETVSSETVLDFHRPGFCRETFPDFQILTRLISEKAISSPCSEIEILDFHVVWAINK